MKNIALMSLITLLVSCGGGNGSSAQKTTSSSSASLNSLLTNKNEKHIRSLRPGNTFEISKKYSIVYLDETGNPVSEEVEREVKRIILKIDGDTIYTLETKKDPESGSEFNDFVHVQSLSKLISERFKDSQVSISGNLVTEKYKIKSSWKQETDSGEVVTFTSDENLTRTFSSEDLGCSEVITSGTINTTASRNKVVTQLPESDYSSVGKCGEDISKENLKNLDLTNVIKCDYTRDLKEEERCTDIIDMSDLLK